MKALELAVGVAFVCAPLTAASVVAAPGSPAGADERGRGGHDSKEDCSGRRCRPNPGGGDGPAAPLPPRKVTEPTTMTGMPKPVSTRWRNFTLGPKTIRGNYLLYKINRGEAPRNWHVHDITITGGQIVDNYGGAFPDSRWERINAINGRASGLLEFSGLSSNVLISDIRFETGEVNTQRGKVYGAIVFAGKGPDDRGDNILIRRVALHGMKAKHDGYPNADGISVEAGYSNVRYEDVRVSGSSDGGIDTKAFPATCGRVWLENNARNFRIWNGIDCDGPVWSINPWTYHIHLMPKADGSSVFRFRDVTFRSKGKQPLIAVDGGYSGRKAKVIIESCTIDVPPGTPRVQDPKGGLDVEWGC